MDLAGLADLINDTLSASALAAMMRATLESVLDERLAGLTLTGSTTQDADPELDAKLDDLF